MSHKLAGDGPRTGPAGWNELRFNLNVDCYSACDLPECQPQCSFFRNFMDRAETSQNGSFSPRPLAGSDTKSQIRMVGCCIQSPTGSVSLASLTSMTDPENQRSQPETAVSSTGPRAIRLEELLQGQRDIQIVHGEKVYRLRLTRNGKLILTK